MKYINKIPFLLFALLLCVVVPVHASQELDIVGDSDQPGSGLLFTSKTVDRISGEYQEYGITFSSLVNEEESIVVSITLNDKTFYAKYRDREVQAVDILPLTDSAEKMKTAMDQVSLIALYNRLEANADVSRLKQSGSLSVETLDRLFRSLNLFIGFFPVDKEFQGFSKSSYLMDSRPKAITYLCNQRGTMHTGNFDIGANPFTQTEWVGDPATDCVGRCGTVCRQAAQPFTPRIYAQDCFDHDLCTREHGDVFGECTDEFNAAIDDYSFGSDCSHYILGTWNTSVDWNCDGNTNAYVVYVHGDGTFTADGGHSGTWQMNDPFGSSVVFNYSTGTVYTGNIDENDLYGDGTMVSLAGTTGCWHAQHVTTQLP